MTNIIFSRRGRYLMSYYIVVMKVDMDDMVIYYI